MAKIVVFSASFINEKLVLISVSKAINSLAVCVPFQVSKVRLLESPSSRIVAIWISSSTIIEVKYPEEVEPEVLSD